MKYTSITKSQNKKYNELCNYLGYAPDFKEARLTLNKVTGVGYIHIETHTHPIFNIRITGFITRRGKLTIITYRTNIPEQDCKQLKQLVFEIGCDYIQGC